MQDSQELKSLIELKGKLSRQIGKAKKSGEPVDDLLSRMKEISLRIKSIKSNEKTVSKKSESSPSAHSSKPLDHQLIPTLFADPTRQKHHEVFSVRLADEADKENWDAFVASNPQSSVYHYWDFRTVIQNAFGHKTFYAAAFDKKGRICGILPATELNSKLFGHFLVSLPYFTYGGVLAESDDIERELISLLISEAKRLGAEHIEFRSTHKNSTLQVKDKKVSMIRSLPKTEEDLWSDIGTKVRAQVKKAERFDLEFKTGKSELLRDFYFVFATNMRDLGTPVYSFGFFEALMVSSLSSKFNIGVIYSKGKPVAACFLMHHNKMVEIPWASTIRKANTMNANMFMYWEVLKFAIRSGAAFFDFGRTTKDSGTYRFKKQWGAKSRQLFWYYWLPSGEQLPELNPDNPKFRLLIKVWQRLPVWLTKLIGPYIVKFLP